MTTWQQIGVSNASHSFIRSQVTKAWTNKTPNLCQSILDTPRHKCRSKGIIPSHGTVMLCCSGSFTFYQR